MTFMGDSRSLALVSGEKNSRGVVVWHRVETASGSNSATALRPP